MSPGPKRKFPTAEEFAEWLECQDFGTGGPSQEWKSRACGPIRDYFAGPYVDTLRSVLQIIERAKEGMEGKG